MRNRLPWITVLSLLLAVFLLVPAQRGQAQSAATATLSPDQVLAEAQRAAGQAADASTAAANAMNSVNMILSFIQVIGLALTLLGGLAALFGIVSTTQYRQKMDMAIAALSERMAAETDNMAQERDRALNELRRSRDELEAQRLQLSQEITQIQERVSRSNRALALMQLGEQQLEFRNIYGALKLYQKAFELDSNNPAINYFLGELYLHTKAIEQGRDHLDRATAEGKDYAPIEAAYGYALRLQAEREPNEARRNLLYAQAETQFRKALLIDENVLNLLRESVYGWLGGLYKRQKAYDKAIEAYQMAHRVTPQSSYPVINLANLYYAQGQIPLARDYYRQSEFNAGQKLERNPGDYWALLNRIVARLALGRQEDALADLRALMERHDGLHTPLINILDDLERLQKSPEPPKDIERVIADLKHFQETQI
jgi:tetratricopeptide (TPR) repeat protein